jgi:HAE1 family hydrophobic/amphiphilic exporter-1
MNQDADSGRSSLAALWVRRPVTGVMVFMVIALFGFFSLSRLKLDLMPDMEFPVIAIITSYQGAGPEAVEQLVSRPIEQAMASVQRVEEITSVSQQSNSMVLVKFAWGSKMDVAETNVRKNLEVFAQPKLPEDAGDPLVFAFDPSMQPVMMMAVQAPGTAEHVRSLAEDDVAPYLSRVDGVASVDVIGGLKREIGVRVLPEWLEAYGISTAQVVGALRGANMLVPGGNLDQGDQDLAISTNAEFRSVDQIKDVVVGSKGRQMVRLADIAEVVDGFQESGQVVRTNGQPAVMMMLRKQSDANTVIVVRAVREAVAKLSRNLPEGAAVKPLFDQALPITLSISNLTNSGWQALVLTALVLFFFLRSWRTSTIVLVSIPLSVVLTFSVMDYLGVTLNMISMAGLALAVGMLVDNSIVVLENIFTRRQRGESLKVAAVQGTNEMAMPIIASTLTTLAVFAPVLFVPGLAGQIFKDLALTICVALLASLFVALTLCPMMFAYMGATNIHGWFDRLMGPFGAWVDGWGGKYGKVLAVAVRHNLVVLVLAGAFFGGTMYVAKGLDVDFMAHNDFGNIQLSFSTAPGTSVTTTTQMVDEVERVIAEVAPEAEVVNAQYGAAEGFGAILGNKSYAGSIRVTLPPRDQRARGQKEIEKILRERFGGLAGIEVKSGGNPGAALMGMGGGDIAVKIFGEDLEQVRLFGKSLKARLETVEGVGDVTFSLDEGQPQITVDLDREQIRLLGLTAGAVAQTINTYFMGTTATLFREAGKEFKVLVRAPRSVREDIEKLKRLPILTPLGLSVPLETVASVSPALGPTTINRENQRRLGTVAISADRVALGVLIQRVEDVLAGMDHPPGVTSMVGGTAEDLKESFQGLAWAFLAAVLLVYMVMASQFESLLEPFVILLAIPFSLSGVALALWVTGTRIEVTAVVGVVLLAGVVVNNGIVLVDVLKNKRLEGMDLRQAAVLAGQSRLRPVLMTTLTTVLSMLPLSLGLGDGAETWAPMARSVVGGLSVSMVLTLLVVPCAYVTLASLVDRRRKGPVTPPSQETTAPAATTAPA